MRNCSLCHIEDRPQFTTELCNCKGGDVLGHNPECKSLEHLVRRVYQFVPKDFMLTPAYAAKGWRVKGIFQGKQAIERFLCRPCIVAAEEILEIDRYRKKVAEEVEGQPEMSMYQVLCS